MYLRSELCDGLALVGLEQLIMLSEQIDHLGVGDTVLSQLVLEELELFIGRPRVALVVLLVFSLELLEFLESLQEAVFEFSHALQAVAPELGVLGSALAQLDFFDFNA